MSRKNAFPVFMMLSLIGCTRIHEDIDPATSPDTKGDVTSDAAADVDATTPPTDASPNPDASTASDTAPDATTECLAQWERCEVGGTACCEGACLDGGYGPTYCQPLGGLGAFCFNDAECESGHCIDGTCVEPGACIPEGSACMGLASACCTGSECETHAVYSVEWGTCVHKGAAGESCESYVNCASGLCVGGICRSSECADVNTSCEAHGDCCSGFCANLDTYLPPRCEASQATGAYCREGIECASLSCEDWACL